MARLLALEWDSREARVVVAQKRRQEIVLEQAFAVDLRSSGGEPAADAEIGPRLGKALFDRGLSRLEAFVALGRANIELRPLTLPPAPEDELPDLVRFQAVKQFSTLGDDWPLDYVPLGPDPQGSLTVLAAAVSPEIVQQIRKSCLDAAIELRRLVLRPFAAAVLLRRRRAVERCVLMVDVLAEDADLTVVTAGRVEFLRTVKLTTSAEPADQVRQLISEIRRTTAAASNRLAGRKVEQVIVCGDGSDHGPLKAQIEQQLGLPVEFFDPLAGVALASDAQSIRPPHVGRYAPLIGLLESEATGAKDEIDFLNPRRRPPPPDQRRRNGILAAAAAVVVLAVGFYYWTAYDDLESQVARLQQELKSLQDEQKRLEPIRLRTAEVDEFAAGDVVWLDELALLSERFLPADDAIVGQLSFGPAPRGSAGGLISLDGHVRSSAHLVRLGGQLRDERHRVTTGSGRFDDKNATLAWKFEGSVAVTPPDPDDPPAAAQPSAGKPDSEKPSAEKPSPEKPSAEKTSASQSASTKASAVGRTAQ